MSRKTSIRTFNSVRRVYAQDFFRDSLPNVTQNSPPPSYWWNAEAVDSFPQQHHLVKQIQDEPRINHADALRKGQINTLITTSQSHRLRRSIYHTSTDTHIPHQNVERKDFLDTYYLPVLPYFFTRKSAFCIPKIWKICSFTPKIC